MNKTISPWNIGSSLYIPANHPDLTKIIINNKYPTLKSIVICLEDAIKSEDILFAKHNLQQTMLQVASFYTNNPSGNQLPLIFVRPRNIAMAKWIITNVDLSYMVGFVLPKFDANCLDDWWQALRTTSLYWMPTLETQDVYNIIKMQQLSDTLNAHPCRDKILVLRIGGNDLMNGLRLRRHRNMTLYDGPIGYLIKMLVTVFAQNNFYLTAPVCEHFSDNDLLRQEVILDINHGLIGKTIIHPSQLTVIDQAYRVSQQEFTEAQQILATTQGVFKVNGSMCEPTTQHRWAADILERAKYFGIY